MFEIKLRAWKDSLDAHRVMEAFMTEKMDAQYALIDSLQEKWHGAAANMFRERYLYMLRNGKYAKTYSHIRSIRQMMEDYLPKLVNLASKCEQLPEQLDYDYYSVPWNLFNENINYNDGYLYLDIDYKGNVDFLCDEIHEKNQAARNLLDDIMDECGDLINFSEEREWNEQAFRKISRVQNFRLAFDEFAMEVERLDEEMAEYFQYITVGNQDEQEKRNVAGTELSQAEIEKVKMVEPRAESGWDALVEGFMDSWQGEGITMVSTATNPFLSQALIYKTAVDMKCRNMTLEESLAESAEFAKGYVQSVPKVAGEMVQGLLELPPAIMELPDTIYEVYKLIDEYGVKAVADGILESTEESIKRVWNEEIINGTARTRGEVTGRAVIAVAELALSVKGLADWLSKGKKAASQTDEIIAGIEKVDDVIDETGEVSTDVKQASKVMDEIQDTVDDVKPMESGTPTFIYKEVKTFTAEETNQWFIDNVKPDYKPPYKPGTIVKEIELTENTIFVRVYDNMPDGSGMYGSWVMKAEDIEGLTPLEIKNKFALPNTPKYVCDVELEAGTHIRVGEVNPLDGWGSGGGTQYDLIGQRIGDFKNERLLEELNVSIREESY